MKEIHKHTLEDLPHFFIFILVRALQRHWQIINKIHEEDRVQNKDIRKYLPLTTFRV